MGFRIAPMFAHDVYRLRRVHRAYLIWAATGLPLAVPAYLLRDSPWWAATLAASMGLRP